MLEGMGGGADENRDGTVPVEEIIAHADRSLPLLAHNIFGGAPDRRSVGYSRGADFALAKLYRRGAPRRGEGALSADPG